ncbi:hypothetical protein BBJ28_00022362, partial [Nothophytophthora sp. Chile5]
MIRPGSATTCLLPTECVSLSPCGFAFWWLSLLAVHLVTCAYTAGYAKFYWGYDLTYLSHSLESYAVGMPRQDFRVIAWVHAAMAAAHGVCVLLMLIGSLWRRTLVFMPWTDTVSQHGKGSAKFTQTASVEALGRSADRTTASRICQGLRKMYAKLVDRRGVFGVNGRYFHILLVCREIVETVLQTVQAVRMSKFLPRAVLNRFYVSLLVLNCWSSVVIYSRLFQRNEARRRFACLVCDCVLDLMSAMGVTIMIVLSYVRQYDVTLAGFDFDKWNDDEWVAQALNEARIVLVVSWYDLTSRAVFYLGIIATTGNMKELLRVSHSSNQVVQTPKLDTVGRQLPDGVRGSILGPMLKLKGGSQGKTLLVKQDSSYKDTGLRSKASRASLYVVHWIFGLWGLVVLAMHVEASMQTPLVQCKPSVSPMAGSLPSCYTADFNCDRLGISAKLEEMTAEFNKFDRNTVVKLNFLHCTALEMPENFHQFKHLREIKVYNSTIQDWSDSASITNTHHPDLATLYMARVNMTDGLLPLGLQSHDFPVNLLDIELCVTNLHTLPDDLHSKWIVGMSIYLENSQLTLVSPTLMLLQPFYLALTGNPISELPPELFEVAGMLYLGLGSTEVSELPRNVLHVASDPAFIVLTGTNISSFWSWIDPLLEEMLEISP